MNQSVKEFTNSVKQSQPEHNQKKKFLNQHPEDWVDIIVEYNKIHITFLKNRLYKLEKQRKEEWCQRLVRKGKVASKLVGRPKNIATIVKEEAIKMSQADAHGDYENGWNKIESEYTNKIKIVESKIQEYYDKFPEYFI